MKNSPFHPKETVSLPASLPVFPLSGALLLPHGRLPLNIFEPRYLAMVQQALASNRLIGMIQRRNSDELYRVGCAGRIVAFEETEDGRFLIDLYGVCRFALGERLMVPTPFLQFSVDFSPFAADLQPVAEPSVDKALLMSLIKQYLLQKGFQADNEALEQSALSRLVVSLSMICPFSHDEKQALLEAPDLSAQAAHLQTLLQMHTLPTVTPSTTVN